MPVPSAARALVAGGACAAALIALPAAASAATVSVTTSSPYAVIGGTTTVTIKSDTPGTITLAQERQSKASGPGRCLLGQFSVDYLRLRGTTRATINYTTPGTAVTVRLSAVSLAYGDGNLFDPTPDTPANADHCFNPWTQFTKVGAILTTSSYDQFEGIAPLTRVL